MCHVRFTMGIFLPLSNNHWRIYPYFSNRILSAFGKSMWRHLHGLQRVQYNLKSVNGGSHKITIALFLRIRYYIVDHKSHLRPFSRNVVFTSRVQTKHFHRLYLCTLTKENQNSAWNVLSCERSNPQITLQSIVNST